MLKIIINHNDNKVELLVDSSRIAIFTTKSDSLGYDKLTSLLEEIFTEITSHTHEDYLNVEISVTNEDLVKTIGEW